MNLFFCILKCKIAMRWFCVCNTVQPLCVPWRKKNHGWKDWFRKENMSVYRYKHLFSASFLCFGCVHSVRSLCCSRGIIGQIFCAAVIAHVQHNCLCNLMQVRSIFRVTELTFQGFEATFKALDASVKGFDDKTQQRAIWNKDAINIVLNSSNSRYH